MNLTEFWGCDGICIWWVFGMVMFVVGACSVWWCVKLMGVRYGDV